MLGKRRGSVLDAATRFVDLPQPKRPRTATAPAGQPRGNGAIAPVLNDDALVIVDESTGPEPAAGHPLRAHQAQLVHAFAATGRPVFLTARGPELQPVNLDNVAGPPDGVPHDDTYAQGVLGEALHDYPNIQRFDKLGHVPPRPANCSLRAAIEQSGMTGVLITGQFADGPALATIVQALRWGLRVTTAPGLVRGGQLELATIEQEWGFENFMSGTDLGPFPGHQLVFDAALPAEV